MIQPIRWTLDPGKPVIRPGVLNPPYDTNRVGSAHVLRVGDRYRLYYWATDAGNLHRICMAESNIDAPNAWRPLGVALERQPDTDYNCVGPGFPFVLPRDDGPWLLYFGAWGRKEGDGKLPNSTGVALSDDQGITWRYPLDKPVFGKDKPYDIEGSGSCCVLNEGGMLRMYYTALGEYSPKPEGVETGHKDPIPHIGVGYAVSRDGINWEKPLDDWIVGPRGFDTTPFEYIASKPFVLREETGYRMWVNTFGTAYRIRSLTSPDGLAWEWNESGLEGELGVGDAGAFDSKQRCYVSALKHEEEYRLWYSGDQFGHTGTGYAVGRAI